MRIAITADHNGIAMKDHLVSLLRADGHEVDDRAANVGERIVDYPPLCADVCGQVVQDKADRAIVIGGSGSGEHIACNKIRGIRAGLGHDRFVTEISRAHNDANVLVIGAKVVELPIAEELVRLWLVTPFKGGRHQQRLDQIAALERGDPLT